MGKGEVGLELVLEVGVRGKGGVALGQEGVQKI